jgi:endo-1,4-beta-D-glucanase Y
LCALALASSLLFGCSSGAAQRPGATGNVGGSDITLGTGGTAQGASAGAAVTLCTSGVCVSTPPATCGGTSGEVTIKSYRPLGTGSADPCAPPVVDWTAPPPIDTPPPAPPPKEEDFACPSGQVRIHVRDIWSSLASPTLGTLTQRPLGVIVIDPVANYLQYGARQESAGCDWYSVCVPNTLTKLQIKPIGADACAQGDPSGAFDATGLMPSSTDIWLDYTGPSSTISADYRAYPNANVGPDKFRLSNDKSAVASELCTAGQPDTSIPAGYTKVHFRWPWSDPQQTGYPGTACGESKLGYATPPYPTSLKVTGLACETQAFLEFQDSHCPWYFVLIPNSQWPTSGTTPAITFRFANDQIGLWTPSLPLPARTATEYWIGYAGAPDNTALSIPQCMNWSQRTNAFYFYTQNPGPGYAHCGGDAAVTTDPCNPPVPDGYSTVHFRYIWAGQKTFTFFPRPELMPHWIVLEVGSNDVICFREQDRPWFNCPVPNSYFKAGATWRAVDKTHSPEWNTVAPREFPSTPGNYWLRWDYGKPDIPASSRFKAFDYYPDGTNGDWSATGTWNDQNCAPRPPPTPVKVGFDFGGWFPYTRTHYAYPFGASLSHVYPDSAKVQDLLNAFVFERYLIWRDNYVTTDALSCGADTARVKTDPPETVSEGQGYGMAISAAIGDKPTFDKLWNFVRHFLSQSSKKYCGGLMGWMWDGHLACRALDAPCDPDSGQCGGQTDSAFDGDVDIGIGLLFAARQWPEYKDAAINWALKMECEINAQYDGKWNYPTPGDTWDKNCSDYPNKPCSYAAGNDGRVNLSYYPPGYFRAFGDFLAAALDPATHSTADRDGHRSFWYKTAATVYEMLERCYDQPNVDPGLVSDWGTYSGPCNSSGGNYDWSRSLWRVGIDAAWFGNRLDIPENLPGSSAHYPAKTRIQAKIDNIQNFYTNFHIKNPPEPNANRFSTLCQDLQPSGTEAGCDPAYGHNSYFVNTAMCAYASVFDNGGATTNDIRREALEEAVSTTVENDRYYQESLGVYTMLFLSGNFPNPMAVPQ